MKTDALFVLFIGLVLFGLTVSAHGEERTVSAMAPWEGDGKIFKVEPEKLLFIEFHWGHVRIRRQGVPRRGDHGLSRHSGD